MPKYLQVDVFTSQKYMGNPLAVFFDADDLSTEDMVRMSAWTNLSEAIFVLKPTVPEADYHIRIFSLEEELPFAGHPTIGACHALIESGLVKPTTNKVYQQCKAGLVELTLNGDSILFELPYNKPKEVTPEILATAQKAVCGTAIRGLRIFDVGPVWLVLELDSAQDVLDLLPDMVAVGALNEHGVSGIQVIGKAPEADTYEVRTFALDINEDPACGSGAGATAAYLRDQHGVRRKVTLHQGTAMKRAATLRIQAGQERDITVAGSAVTVIEGTY